jgi:hypothetical protein
MRRRTVVLIAGVAAGALLAVGGAAWATSGGGEAPLSGEARAKAVEAALAEVGGGTVVETEAGDDGAAYGVEIRRADGSVVEVSLDKSFAVIGSEGDDDTKGEESGAGSD